MSNLDPALDSSRQQRTDLVPGHNSYGRISPSQADQYSQDATNASQPYGNPAQQTPYYHYQSNVQSTGTAHDSVSASSAQPTPDAQGYLPPNDSGLLQPEDAQGAADDAKRQRACEACRGLKVRCDQDPLQPDVPCKRCAKAGRQCIITQPSRKRQKKADSRVAELEKKLDALTAVLHNRSGGVSVDASLSGSTPGELPQAQQLAWQTESPAQPTEPPLKRRRTDEAPSEWDTRFAKLQLSHKLPDAKHYLHPDNFAARVTSLIPPAQGAELFRRYTEEMTAQLPLVVFPKGTTGDQVFQDKPVLYLSIIAAASFGMVPTNVTMQLQDESMAAIADLCVRRGVKSLELIQAMHIIALFYKPPAKAEQTNFYQIIHMAATMALDIGLGRRYNSRKQLHALGRQEVLFSVQSMTGQNSDSLDARRAWLGCYYLAATAAMVLRRPNLVHWTAYMKECIEVLETSPDAYPSDRLLCEHVKIQHICEDVGQQFLMDDATAQVSINDPKVTYALNVLENQLSAWKQQVPPEVRHPSLTFFEHVTSLYLHEIALHSNHNIEDFRLPFTEESLKNVDSTPEALSPTKISAIEACLKAAHGILSTTLTFSIEELLAMPMVVFFVRCVYALVILIKMHVAITIPGSELGKILKPEDLKIEEFVQQLLIVFAKMGESRAAKPEKIMRIMVVLKEWFGHHKETVAQERSRSTSVAAQSAPTTQVNEASRYSQSALQMLSQVASGQQQQPQSNDWTVDAPNAIGYQVKRGSEQNEQRPPAMMIPGQDGAPMYDPNILSMLDMLSGQDYGFGSGFEQAMDMTMGSMGDIPGYGLGTWSMGQDSSQLGYNMNAGTNPGAQGPWQQDNQ